MQPNAKKAATNAKKKRSQWEKEGKFRYVNRRLKQLRDEMHEEFRKVEARMRVLTNSLAPFMEIDKDYIQSIVCQDEVDEALLQFLRSKGHGGTTPAEACESADLSIFRLKPFQVTRRIQRMNKRLKAEIDKPVANSLHRRWIITRFVANAWNSTKSEIVNDVPLEAH